MKNPSVRPGRAGFFGTGPETGWPLPGPLPDGCLQCSRPVLDPRRSHVSVKGISVAHPSVGFATVQVSACRSLPAIVVCARCQGTLSVAAGAPPFSIPNFFFFPLQHAGDSDTKL